MTNDLPAPPVPADCDLAGFNFMPLDCIRLVQSDLTAISTGDEFKAAVILWAKSWANVPAGSLTDDDRVLAHAAGLTPKAWAKVKPMALRGWYKASDGRLYHPVVSEKVAEAWAGREEHRESLDSARERKRQEREDRKALFSTLRAAGQVPPIQTPTRDLRAMVTDMSRVTSVTGHANVTEQSRLREGEGKGKGKGQSDRTRGGASDPGPDPTDQPAQDSTGFLDHVQTPPPGIRAKPPRQTPGDLLALVPALHAPPDDRERLGTTVALYGFDLTRQAAEALAAAAQAKPVGQRRVFVREVGDWLAARFDLTAEDYARAGIAPPATATQAGA